jgi:hypothetical protein
MLFLIVSQWYVVALDPDGRWAVTYFSDSGFTGAGMDIYAREPCLSRADEEEALAAIFADPFLSERGRGLFRVQHAGAEACRRARP